jgi:hypothetical protein
LNPPIIIVEGLVATDLDDTDLRNEHWSLALDQRAFGPRRLLVAFADRVGRLRSLAHTPRSNPPELGLAYCIDHMGRDAAAAVAYCDEPVSWGPPPPDLGLRFALARAIAAEQGVHLVDWIACDDDKFRSTRLAIDGGTEWWDVPD